MKKLILLSVIIFCIKSGIAQVPASWAVTGIGGGGALFAPTINPASDSDFYISNDLSAMYHTIDYGKSYTILDGHEVQGFHNSTVLYTSTANLLYSINYANNLIVPVKSTDGGKTWTTLKGNPDASQEAFSLNVNYGNPNQLVLDYYGDIYFSNDGGNTFTDIHTANNNGAGVFVAGLLFDGNTIYISTNDGLLVSTNGGSSFSFASLTGIPSTEAVYAFAGAKEGSVTKFICLTGSTGNVYNQLMGSDCYGLNVGVYVLDYNKSTVWQKEMTGISAGNDYPMFAGMAANDTATCYLAGGSSAGAPDILKSTNGGKSWSQVFNTTNNSNIITGWCGDGGDKQWSWAELPFGFAVSPTNSKVAVFGDYSMITRTADGGKTWIQAYVNPADEHPAGSTTPAKKTYHSIGMENTACWDIFWADSSNMFSGYSDIFMIRSTDAGQSWSFNYNYTPGNCVYRIAKSNSGKTLYAATSSIHDMYKSYKVSDASIDGGTGNLIYSTDNGATWNQLHNFNHPVYWIAMDPNDSDRAYASVINYGSGAGGIYVCANLNLGSSSTWTQLAAPPRTEGHPASITVLNNGDVLCSFSGRYNNNKFTNSSGVFLYHKNSSTWSDVSGANLHYYTHDVVVDPNDVTQQTWYACVYSGFGGNGNGMGGLYKTTDGGTTWTEIFSGGDVPSCTFSPTNANELYVPTSGNGLFYSSNVNNSAPTFSSVGSYYFSNPERIFFNPYNSNEIWIASFGYGMDVGNTKNNGLTNIENETGFELYPNPSSGDVHLQFTKPLAGILSLYDITGQLIETVELSGQQNAILNCSNLSNGIYLINITDAGNGKTLIRKLIVAR